MNAREVISIFYSDSKARLGELVVDAFINETHTLSSEITEHPIEGGITIVDHIHNLPFSLSIDGIISNTPRSLVGLTAFDSATRYFGGENNDFAIIAFEKIEEIFAKRYPISIATSLKTYHKMVLESLCIERGEVLTSSLRFSCTAKQIRLAHQKRIKTPKPKPSRAQPKQKKGLQEAKPLPPAQVEAIKSEKSLIFSGGKTAMEKVKDAVKNLFGW